MKNIFRIFITIPRVGIVALFNSLRNTVFKEQKIYILIVVLVKLSLLTALMAGNAGYTFTSERPNVLLVITDDQGYCEIGFNGNPVVKTPVLDSLAFNSVVFDNFYAYPVCSPTRAALMTGKHALRTGVTDTQEGMSILRPSEITIAEALKTAGYKTGLFGKWHLGDNVPTRPIDQGFERSLTFVGGMIGAPYNPMDGNAYFNPILIDDGVEKRFKGYCADIFTDHTIDFIRSSGDARFFAYLAFNTPHHPLTVEDRYANPYRKAGLSEETSRYYGMISNIDDNIGRVLDALKISGTLDNTMIIFLGDNGPSGRLKELWNHGLRGYKCHVYENGIRVPMFIKLPGISTQGHRLKNLTSAEDIMPTILEICQLTTPTRLDGQSLMPLLADPSASWPDRSFYFRFHRGVRPDQYRNIAVRNGAYKLVQPIGIGKSFDPTNMAFELYDLSTDPFEQNNIESQYPEILNQLKTDYDNWFAEVCSAGFDPVRTWIGSDLQNPVMLTRQDWRGGGLFDGDLGYFNLDIKTTGIYRITCRWSNLLKKTHPVTIKLNDRIIEKEMLYAESECRFDEVTLSEGPCRLEAWVEIDGQKCGFRFVEIEKLPVAQN
jgi:arylsulfatase/arylsulfatase A